MNACEETYYLAPGDVIAYAGTICRVLRVNDCSALVAIPQPQRTFTTLWGKTVTIARPTKLEHISPDSCVPIIERATP